MPAGVGFGPETTGAEGAGVCRIGVEGEDAVGGFAGELGVSVVSGVVGSTGIVGAVGGTGLMTGA
jgi:hypothetical protein